MPKKDKSILNIISYNIKKNRLKSDFDIKTLARLANVTVQTWYKWERGLVIPDDINKGKIASLLGVSVADLVQGIPGTLGRSENAANVDITPVSIGIPFPAGARPAVNLNERPTRGLAAADDSEGSRTPDTDEEGDPYWFPESLVLVPVMGDSMSPVILPGQYVGIDREREGFEKNDGIYVVSVVEPGPDDEYPEPRVGTFIKRCEQHENMYYLKSVGAYSPFSVHVDHCRIWPVLGVWYDDRGRPPKGF